MLFTFQAKNQGDVDNRCDCFEFLACFYIKFGNQLSLNTEKLRYKILEATGFYNEGISNGV